ncbi:MAG: DUF4870 domain-containing protein [Succinivibrionaceae bacterium]
MSDNNQNTPVESVSAEATATTKKKLFGFEYDLLQPFSVKDNRDINPEAGKTLLIMWILMFFISFLSPIIFFFVKGDNADVKQTIKNVFNYLITDVVLLVVCIILGILSVIPFIGILFGILALLVYLVIFAQSVLNLIFGIIAAASNKEFKPFLTVYFIK